MVPVGGYSLHLWCRGSGSPTVVIDPGGYGGTALHAADLVETLAQRWRTCAFDPPGQGWSEAGPTPGAIPERYRAFESLMEISSIDEPFILVAESSGAHVARLFTAAHPERVRGLVLVDPAFDDLERERSNWSADERQRAARMRRLAPFVPVLARFGLHRPLLSPTLSAPLAEVPAELRPLVREQLLSRKSVTVLVERALLRESGLAEVRGTSLPRDLPLIVLTAGIDDPASLTPTRPKSSPIIGRSRNRPSGGEMSSFKEPRTR